MKTAKESLTERAKRMYTESTDNDPIIHSNRFPSWGELSRKSRQEWLDRAEDAEHAGRADENA